MKRVSIDLGAFLLAFDRDADFHDHFPQTTYLNLETGNISWVYDDDEDASEIGVTPEDNRAERLAIESNPSRYLEVPGRSHGEHHEIIQDFVDSDWTDDKARKGNAADSYRGSIGRWIKNVDDPAAVDAHRDYKATILQRQATAFLESQGIQPEWR